MTASPIDMWLMGVTWQTMGILVCAPNHFIVLNRIAHSISFCLLCDSTFFNQTYYFIYFGACFLISIATDWYYTYCFFYRHKQ